MQHKICLGIKIRGSTTTIQFNFDFQNKNFNIKMESQNGSVIPGIISKQELLFAGTMKNILNMAVLTAHTFDEFGRNITNIQERDPV